MSSVNLGEAMVARSSLYLGGRVMGVLGGEGCMTECGRSGGYDSVYGGGVYDNVYGGGVYDSVYGGEVYDKVCTDWGVYDSIRSEGCTTGCVRSGVWYM